MCLTFKLCLEHVEGNTLELFVGQNLAALHDNSIKNIAIQLLDALEYLHMNNTFHRDLKVCLAKRTFFKHFFYLNTQVEDKNQIDYYRIKYRKPSLNSRAYFNLKF